MFKKFIFEQEETEEVVEDEPPQNDNVEAEEEEIEQEEIEDETLLNKTDIGKIYQIKKIYHKLISLSDLIDYINEPTFQKTKLDINEAIEMFELIINNYDKFREDIDEVIKNYTAFLKSVKKEIDSLDLKKY